MPFRQVSLTVRVTVAGRAIHRLDQFWVTGNFAFHSPKVTEATEAR
jgi:hypothetical protein